MGSGEYGDESMIVYNAPSSNAVAQQAALTQSAENQAAEEAAKIAAKQAAAQAAQAAAQAATQATQTPEKFFGGYYL